VLALGGINAANAAMCRAAGAAGIAVMGEIMRADDPQAIATNLIRAISPHAAVSLGLACSSSKVWLQVI
jgi:thiamine-phosphate pyrophosphorylase